MFFVFLCSQKQRDRSPYRSHGKDRSPSRSRKYDSSPEYNKNRRPSPEYYKRLMRSPDNDRNRRDSSEDDRKRRVRDSGTIYERKRRRSPEYGSKSPESHIKRRGSYEYDKKRWESPEYGRMRRDSPECGRRRLESPKSSRKRCDSSEYGRKTRESSEDERKTGDSFRYRTKESENSDYDRKRRESPNFGRSKRESPDYGRKRPESLEYGRKRPESPEYSRKRPESPEYSRKRPESLEYSRKRPESLEYSRKRPESPEYSRKRPESPEYSRERPESPEYSRERPESPEYSRERPESPDYDRKSWGSPSYDRKRHDSSEHGGKRQKHLESDRRRHGSSEYGLKRQESPEYDRKRLESPESDSKRHDSPEYELNRQKIFYHDRKWWESPKADRKSPEFHRKRSDRCSNPKYDGKEREGSDYSQKGRKQSLSPDYYRRRHMSPEYHRKGHDSDSSVEYDRRSPNYDRKKHERDSTPEYNHKRNSFEERGRSATRRSPSFSKETVTNAHRDGREFKRGDLAFAAKTTTREEEESVISTLMQVYDDLRPEVIRASVNHPDNRVTPFDKGILLERCLKDLRTRSTWRKSAKPKPSSTAGSVLVDNDYISRNTDKMSDGDYVYSKPRETTSSSRKNEKQRDRNDAFGEVQNLKDMDYRYFNERVFINREEDSLESTERAEKLQKKEMIKRERRIITITTSHSQRKSPSPRPTQLWRRSPYSPERLSYCSRKSPFSQRNKQSQHSHRISSRSRSPPHRARSKSRSPDRFSYYARKSPQSPDRSSYSSRNSYTRRSSLSPRRSLGGSTQRFSRSPTRKSLSPRRFSYSPGRWSRSPKHLSCSQGRLSRSPTLSDSRETKRHLLDTERHPAHSGESSLLPRSERKERDSDRHGSWDKVWPMSSSERPERQDMVDNQSYMTRKDRTHSTYVSERMQAISESMHLRKDARQHPSDTTYDEQKLEYKVDVHLDAGDTDKFGKGYRQKDLVNYTAGEPEKQQKMGLVFENPTTKDVDYRCTTVSGYQSEIDYQPSTSSRSGIPLGENMVGTGYLMERSHFEDDVGHRQRRSEGSSSFPSASSAIPYTKNTKDESYVSTEQVQSNCGISGNRLEDLSSYQSTGTEIAYQEKIMDDSSHREQSNIGNSDGYYADEKGSKHFLSSSTPGQQYVQDVVKDYDEREKSKYGYSRMGNYESDRHVSRSGSPLYGSYSSRKFVGQVKRRTFERDTEPYSRDGRPHKSNLSGTATSSASLSTGHKNILNKPAFEQDDNRRLPKQKPGGLAKASSSTANTTTKSSVVEVGKPTPAPGVDQGQTTSELHTKRKKRRPHCFMKGCHMPQAHMRKHVMGKHLTLSSHQMPPDLAPETMMHILEDILNEIAALLECRNFEELLEKIIVLEYFPAANGIFEIKEMDYQLMSDFHMWLESTDLKIEPTINPPNCVAALVNWRVLATMISFVGEDKVDLVKIKAKHGIKAQKGEAKETKAKKELGMAEEASGEL